MSKFIVDISKWNGRIDWPKVAPLMQMVFIKATEGATITDPRFRENAAACELHSLTWGAYHFATWNSEDEKTDAAMEANHFLSVVGKLPAYYVLDIESNRPIPYTKQEMVEYVASFLNTLASAGVSRDRMVIYASPGFLAQYLPADHPFKDIKLWVADYTGAINPVPWPRPWLHQYTQTGKVPGMNGYVDLNRLV
jgi:lysozyme